MEFYLSSPDYVIHTQLMTKMFDSNQPTSMKSGKHFCTDDLGALVLFPAMNSW